MQGNLPYPQGKPKSRDMEAIGYGACSGSYQTIDFSEPGQQGAQLLEGQ